MSFSKNCVDTINSDVQISNSIMKTTSMVNCSQQSLPHPILMKVPLNSVHIVINSKHLVID